MKGFSLLTAALLLSAACATTAGTMGNFASWDLDRDTVISRTEFDSNVRFGGLDANNNGYLDTAEFDPRGTTVTFSSWDLDADSRVTLAEYRGGLFTAFDANRDGFIQRSEFNTARSVWFD